MREIRDTPYLKSDGHYACYVTLMVTSHRGVAVLEYYFDELCFH